MDGGGVEGVVEHLVHVPQQVDPHDDLAAVRGVAPDDHDRYGGAPGHLQARRSQQQAGEAAPAAAAQHQLERVLRLLPQGLDVSSATSAVVATRSGHRSCTRSTAATRTPCPAWVVCSTISGGANSGAL